MKYFFSRLAGRGKIESSQEQLTSAHRHPFLLADMYPPVSSPLRCYCLFSPGAKMCQSLLARLALGKPSLPINPSTKDRVQTTPTCQVNGTWQNAYGAWSRMPGPQQVVTRLWCVVHAVIYVVNIIIITITLIVNYPWLPVSQGDFLMRTGAVT